MSLPLSPLVRRLLGLSAESFPEMAASRFGAQQDMDRAWSTFEPVARTLVDSFYSTIDDARQDRLARRLDALAPELRGIAYEGAGMGLMFLDSLVPPGRRLARFAHGHGAPYRSLLYIGAGLVLPRVPRSARRFLDRVDPFHRWFVMDGYGFYEGFFAWERTVQARQVGTRLPGYAARAYDQGLGRSLWFSTGANVPRIISTLDTFAVERKPDLWSGVGLACAYAAGVMDRGAVTALAEAAGTFAADLATGAAVASTFRAQTRQPAPHTDLACDVLWRRSSDDVAAIALTADTARRTPVHPGSYGEWRDGIRAVWVAESIRTPERGRTA
jgi:hypothetical protein